MIYLTTDAPAMARVRRALTRIVCGLALAACLSPVVLPASAQPLRFGSADDPREAVQRVPWRLENVLYLRAGVSLIAAQWRAVTDVGFDVVTPALTGRLSGTVRAGYFGLYDPDVSELYDVLRVVDFLRYNAPPGTSIYARLGPINRLTLGTGHLVEQFSSSIAWDRRTIGAEALWQTRYVSLAAFTDNLLLDGITGGRLSVRPFAWADDPRTRSFALGVNYVTDLYTQASDRATLEGYNVELTFDALASGTVRLRPYASFASYTNYGSGLSLGAEFSSLNFIDFARFHVRAAISYNGESFIPGYVGSFYTVNNRYDRLFDREDTDAEGGGPLPNYEGTTLSGALGGNAFTTELRVLLFERFEFWYFFRRHYGVQTLSEYHLRLFVRAADRFLLDASIDRGGLRNIFSLFNDLSEQSHLSFLTEYQVLDWLWLHVRARYTFEAVGPRTNGIQGYLVQRRFEPMAGVRFVF